MIVHNPYLHDLKSHFTWAHTHKRYMLMQQHYNMHGLSISQPKLNFPGDSMEFLNGRTHKCLPPLPEYHNPTFGNLTLYALQLKVCDSCFSFTYLDWTLGPPSPSPSLPEHDNTLVTCSISIGLFLNPSVPHWTTIHQLLSTYH